LITFSSVPRSVLHRAPQAENATAKQSDLVRVVENTRKNLENEING
jgi:hypothetical protein